MSNPGRKAYFDPDGLLTNFTTAEIQGAEGFVHAKAFPTVPVTKQTADFKKYDRSFFNRSLVQFRPPSTKAAEGKFDFEPDDSYNCKRQAIRDLVDWDTIDNASIGDPEQDSAEYVGQQILLKREEDWTAAAFANSIWSTNVDVSATNLWSVAAGTPIEDIKTQGVAAIVALAGFRFRPTKAIIDYPTWLDITENPNVLDRLADVDDRITTEMKFAALIGVKEVLIGGGIKTTSKPNAAAVITEGIQGNGLLLIYTAERVGLKTPTGGVNFAWAGGRGNSSEGVRTRRYTEDDITSNVVEAETYHDFKVTTPDLGVFFRNTI